MILFPNKYLADCPLNIFEPQIFSNDIHIHILKNPKTVNIFHERIGRLKNKLKAEEIIHLYNKIKKIQL